ANIRMADGIRVATVRRGVDPRDCCLLAFGGAAGLHASAVARELSMKRVAVPFFAAGLSAWGMLHTDLRYEMARSELNTGGVPDDDALRAIWAALEKEGRARVASWFGGAVETRRAADMRYGEQVFDIAVPLDHVAWEGAGLADRLRDAFHARHEALFTYALRQEEVVLVNARLAVIGHLPPMPAPAGKAAGAIVAPRGARRIMLEGGVAEVPVYDFAELGADQPVAGPAIVESDTTTVLLLPGDAARMDARGWLEITLPEQA
ncbi:MAG: hydantoinase/oxoprolinase family protein, partial [Acetobacteraceae bacterium]|nr:hydantoinase/oxoprolinase family protein [Acetobacteraceae bacterium]